MEQLEKIMKTELGSKFKGVYSKDSILPPSKPNTCYIVNLQDSDAGQGSHWCGITQGYKKNITLTRLGNPYRKPF